MSSDEGLVHCASVGVDADFGSDVARVRGGKGKPFIVRGETRLRGSVGVSVRTKSSYCTKPRFLDENDVEFIVVFLQDTVHAIVIAVNIDRLYSDGVFRH